MTMKGNRASWVLPVFAALLMLRVGTGGAVLAFPDGEPLSATTLQGNQDRKAVVGAWELHVLLDGVNDNQPPVIIVILEAGNKLAGKVTVPKVEPTANGFQTIGSTDLTLDDLKFNGKTLSFQVGEDGSGLDADLTMKNDSLFEGRWRSEIKGRWKGSKNEFAGAIIMKRKK